jgi:hypothetical protein
MDALVGLVSTGPTWGAVHEDAQRWLLEPGSHDWNDAGEFFPNQAAYLWQGGIPMHPDARLFLARLPAMMPK